MKRLTLYPNRIPSMRALCGRGDQYAQLHLLLLSSRPISARRWCLGEQRLVAAGHRRSS